MVAKTTRAASAASYDYDSMGAFASESQETRQGGPVLGMIEVERIERVQTKLRGADSGGSVGECVDDYFRQLAREGAEIREFKLVFFEPHQFEQVLKTSAQQVAAAEGAGAVHPRWRNLVE